MTNGVAYVLDEVDAFPGRVNTELVQVERLMDSDELSLVYDLVRQHFERTASRRAEAVLDLWDVFRGQFWKVSPRPAAAPTPAPQAATPSAAVTQPVRVNAPTR
jgi:glutamate synthase (ferredoxin)